MSQTVSALLYLWSRSTWNALRLRLRRLRQPTYLLGALLGLAYFYFLLVFPAQRARERPQAMAPPDFGSIMSSSATLFMGVGLICIWLWRRERTVLQFSQAEIAFLFPAPVRYPTLVHYALLRGQAAVLLSAVFIAFLTQSWQDGWIAALRSWLSFYLAMGIYALHVQASGFTITRLVDRGIGHFARQCILVALLGAGLWLAASVGGVRLPNEEELSLAGGGFDYIRALMEGGALHWVTWPLRAMLRPFDKSLHGLEYASAVAVVLMIYALHYLWARYAQIHDNESTIARADKIAAILAAFRKGKLAVSVATKKPRDDPFRLRPTGSAGVALLWKNLLSTRSYIRPRTYLLTAFIIVILNLAARNNPLLQTSVEIITALVAMLTGYLIVVGPLFLRQDLRSDLANADLLKSWPLEGWSIVLGELLAPLIVLTQLLWLFLLQIGVGSLPDSPEEWTVPVRIVTLTSLALVLPFVSAALLLLANAVAVVFPAWTPQGSAPQIGGIEALGQRILMMLGSLLVLAVAILPAALFGAIVWFPSSWILGSLYAVIPATLTACLVLAGELAWGTNWLGQRFDAYDLTQ